MVRELSRQKVKVVCSYCGSDDVVADAYVAWDYEGQCWKVVEAFNEDSFCSNCDGECSINWTPVDPFEEAVEEATK